MNLADVLAAVAERVPYLRAATDVTGDDWVHSDVLVADRAVLTTVVERAMPGLATDDVAVAASLLVQAYAFRLAGVPLVAHALGLPVPSVAAACTAVRVDKPRPSAVAYLAPDVARLGPEPLADQLIGGHFASFVDAAHGCFRVGARLLWGNVASSCAAAFRAVEGASESVEERVEIRARALAFVAAAAPWFDGLGSFSTVHVGNEEGWYWDRGNCCLWYRTERGGLCDNCSLHDPATLREQRVLELSGGRA